MSCQPEGSAGLIGGEVPGVKDGPWPAQGGRRLPQEAAGQQQGEGLPPGAHRGQPAPPEEQVGPGDDGRPGKDIVGVAGQKPACGAAQRRAQPEPVKQVEAAGGPEDGPVKPPPAHRNMSRNIAPRIPTITASTVIPKDMGASGGRGEDRSSTMSASERFIQCAPASTG